MIRMRRADERGHTHLGWLDSRHTFSFGGYHDPGHMGFGALRVINDDHVAAGGGFGTHGHHDMEILSYVLDGALAHKDSMGTAAVIRPGSLQMMRAGTGVRHSEYNASSEEPVHFLQIWIEPDVAGLEPTYGELHIDQDAAALELVLLASRDGRDGSLQVQQDVDVWLAQPSAGQTRAVSLRAGRSAWVHVAVGDATLNGQPMAEGDGAAVTDEDVLTIEGEDGAEVLVFDLGAAAAQLE